MSGSLWSDRSELGGCLHAEVVKYIASAPANVKDGSIVNDCGLFSQSGQNQGSRSLNRAGHQEFSSGQEQGFHRVVGSLKGRCIFRSVPIGQSGWVKPAAAARITRLELFTARMVVVRDALSVRPRNDDGFAFVPARMNDPEAAMNVEDPISLAPSFPVAASPFAPKSVTGVNPSGRCQ